VVVGCYVVDYTFVGYVWLVVVTSPFTVRLVVTLRLPLLLFVWLFWLLVAQLVIGCCVGCCPHVCVRLVVALVASTLVGYVYGWLLVTLPSWLRWLVYLLLGWFLRLRVGF